MQSAPPFLDLDAVHKTAEFPEEKTGDRFINSRGIFFPREPSHLPTTLLLPQLPYPFSNTVFYAF